MKAEELRIGNILRDKYTGDNLIVLELTKDRITFDYITDKKWQAEPIPLTEEIILKCGFEIEEGRFGNEYHLDDFILYTSEQLSICFCWDNFIKDIKHLHQLQNLYFALTGQELDVKLWR